MKKIVGENKHSGTEYFVLTIDDEPTEIHFGTQVDDLLISTVDQNILINWDMDAWDDEKCLLIKTYDNLKELGNVRCTKMMVKIAESGMKTKCYICVQRN